MKTQKERKFAFITQIPEYCLDSPMEREVFNGLKELGYNPILQYPISGYFADFAFPDNKIIIEYDGKQHQQSIRSDVRRDKTLMDLGWNIFRVNHFNSFFEMTMNGHWVLLCRDLKDVLEDLRIHLDNNFVQKQKRREVSTMKMIGESLPSWFDNFERRATN